MEKDEIKKESAEEGKFQKEKKNFLGKLDKSKKGEIDKEVYSILKKINSFKGYYTTSSCSGRILILERKGKQKYKTEWHYSSHKKANFEDIKKTLENLESIGDIWLKYEPFILHVCCQTIDEAEELLRKANASGFKYSGIKTLKNKILIEINGTDRMETIIYSDGKILCDDNYLKIMIDSANSKMKKNFERMKLFNEKI